MQEPQSHVKKVVFMSDERVGKTSLLLKITKPLEPLIKEYKQTRGVEFINMVLGDDPEACDKLQIWDVGGNESYRISLLECLKGAELVCLMWDPQIAKSVERLRDFLDAINRYAKKIPLVFVQCKADLSIDEKILEAQRQTISEMLDGPAMFLKTSAKTGEGLEDLKNRLIESQRVGYQTTDIHPRQIKEKKTGCWCCKWSRKKTVPDVRDNLLEPKNTFN